MKSRWSVENIGNLHGSISIVSGANNGIGYETAKELAGHGSTVIMACRNAERAAAAKSEIVEVYPDAKLEFMPLDLADLDSVKAFCQEFSTKYPRLNLLVNNAGILNTRMVRQNKV